MKTGSKVQLLLNEKRDHGDMIEKLLKKADRLECLVAFAKMSALSEIYKPLNQALKGGLNARFAIGLDFFLTQPSVLKKLLKLTKYPAFNFYLGNSNSTFHPKIYAFEHGDTCSVIVGSANLTSGGFSRNHEASALVEDTNGTLMDSVSKHFDTLIAREDVVLADTDLISEYERKYVIHDLARTSADRKARELSREPQTSLATLAYILEQMKSDSTERGFKSQRIIRNRNRREANDLLKNWAAQRGDPRLQFRIRFESLIAKFHSGGLQRSKNKIAKRPTQFVAAVKSIVATPRLPPGEAFTVLMDHFNDIPGAGVNLLTEILHALDNKRYAVMNQNAVSGLLQAGISAYPLHPTKGNMDADDYSQYCSHANTVRLDLGLENFTELDALFNYAYW